MSHMIDLANTIRLAQNGNKEQFSQFIHEMVRLAS
jgi:hypothetical protein